MSGCAPGLQYLSAQTPAWSSPALGSVCSTDGRQPADVAFVANPPTPVPLSLTQSTIYYDPMNYNIYIVIDLNHRLKQYDQMNYTLPKDF